MREFYAHYKTPGHVVELSVFIAAAQSVEEIGNAILRETLGLSARVEVYVDVPEEGSHLQKILLGVTIVGGFLVGTSTFLANLSTIADSEFLNSLSKARYDRTITEMAIEFLDRKKLPEENEQTENILDDPEKASEVCKHLEKIIASTSRIVLEDDPESLNFKRNRELEYILKHARASFYSACFDSKKVKAVGFSRDEEFPVDRSVFLERALFPVRDDEEASDVEWIVQRSNVVVSSPNFRKNDQTSRKWKGHVELSGVRLFTIEDEKFWESLRKHKLVFDDNTELSVQWVIGFEKGREKHRVVVRVLKVNGANFGSAVSDESALEIVGANEPRQGSKQRSLFDL